MIIIVPRFFILLSLLVISIQGYNNNNKYSYASTCDQHCPIGNLNGTHVQYPFGFSPGCKIQLDCNENGEMIIGMFKVQDVTADSILIDLPANCSRTITDLRQLWGKNFAMTRRNELLLDICSQPYGCEIPTDMFEAKLKMKSCTPSNVTTCYSDAYRNTSSSIFLEYYNLRKINCRSVVSSIATLDGSLEETSTLQPWWNLQTVELGWWVEDCGFCHDLATCDNFTIPGVRSGGTALGHRCKCNQGYTGDGFKDGDGCRKGTKNRTKKGMVIMVETAAPVAGFVILVILAYCFRKKFSFLEICGRTEKLKNVEAFLKNYGPLAPKRYYYSEVKMMTNSFKIKLGQGGYGCVYKGKLHDGSPIAVKVLKESKGSGEEFINEVASISRTSHVNIVTLLGFCFQGRKRALVYEFMPNGSLDKFIYGGISSTGRQLGLQILYKIAVGIARGLEYLHRGCNTRIVHFDIKPHNILLDKDFCPKISDFGLAKLCPGKESIVSIVGVRGTVGYIAPEVVCKSFGGVSHKSDVYSYGMMIFEMVGGRKNIEVGVNHSSEIYFPDWIYKRIDQGDNLGLDGIVNEEENELARKMIIVSLWCIQTDPSSRPSITNVVEMLEGSLQALQIPPKPVFSSPSRAADGFSTVNIT